MNLLVTHHFVKFNGYRLCASRDIMCLGSSSLYATILPSLLTKVIVVVQIYNLTLQDHFSGLYGCHSPHVDHIPAISGSYNRHCGNFDIMVLVTLQDNITKRQNNITGSIFSRLVTILPNLTAIGTAVVEM